VKKISIGIFSMLTVILFLLSISVSVSAENIPFHKVDMTTKVYSNPPYVEAIITPYPRYNYLLSSNPYWAYLGWSLDIDNGDNVFFVSTCTWFDYYSPPIPDLPTGYHAYSIDATYRYGETVIEASTNYYQYTFGAYDPPETDNQDIGVTFYECHEGGTIEVIWQAYVINLHESTEENPVEDYECLYGRITLI